MIRLARGLAAAGVLGLNRRNADYTLTHNPRHLYPLVDDKLRTKRLAAGAGIAVPELYGVIEIERQIREVHELLAPHSEFVVKPAQGSGGDGIIVISARSGEHYRKVDGQLISRTDLEHHVSGILSGMYSLGGQPDRALFEYRVQFAPVFEAISYRGVPDIRIIVFLGVPVMSMLRLPTRFSGGKANLHQGAIGAGIDIATGTTVNAVCGNSRLDRHTDTGQPLTGIVIPGWENLLMLASRCHALTGLGYQGVDIVLDRDRGPLILELNARPGLSIQIANGEGLLPRLRRVERHGRGLTSPADCVQFAREYFASVMPAAT